MNKIPCEVLVRLRQDKLEKALIVRVALRGMLRLIKVANERL